MTTYVLQANRYARADDAGERLLRDLRFDHDADTVKRVLDAGLYVAVAMSSSDDLEALYLRTQNGGQFPSWSKVDDDLLTALGGGAILTEDGRSLGYMSTSPGDVMLVDGKIHVCARIGFEPLSCDVGNIEAIPVVNGGTLGDVIDRQIKP